MPDIDDGFDKAFEGFGEEGTPPVTPPAEPPKDDPVQEDGGKDDTEPKEPKKDDKPAPEEPKKDEATPPAADEKKEEEGAKPPTPPETPPAPEEPKPLTRDDVTSIINNIRTEERASSKEIETTTNEVLEAYYPEGLSNTLVDQSTGKELKTPQDVVEASGNQMSIEEATQWLMNEQYKLDQDIARIKNDAKKVAETTINFKRDSMTALQKYEPLFKWQPHLQKKAFDLLMMQVKADKEKGVILQAPDVLDLYDTYLEPYQKAFEYANNQPATNPTPPATPPPATPSADDRLDENGDGGASPVDDPNDFAQQVNKELAKGI